MLSRLCCLLLVINLHHVTNSPLRVKRSPRDFQTNYPLIPTRTVFSNIGHSVPALPPNTHTVTVIPQNTQNILITKHKGLLAPIPLSQFIVPKLQLVSQSNLQYNTLQHIYNKDTVKIPVYTQSVPQNSTTHPSLVLIPIHSHLVPVHDLSVVPLQRARGEQKVIYRAMEKKEEEEEPTNQYRNFYGGFGNGLFFGGHGHGHGFYAYGK